jgi:hypothetical protein
MSVTTVLLDTNVFTAWLRPRSNLLPMYGKHVFGQRIAIAQQTVAEVRYGAVAAGWGRAAARSRGTPAAPQPSAAGRRRDHLGLRPATPPVPRAGAPAPPEAACRRPVDRQHGDPMRSPTRRSRRVFLDCPDLELLTELPHS